MRRKLVKQGTATMMISLPSKWIKANDLGKGDEIDIEEKQNSIVISLGGKKSKRQTEISLASLTESSIRTLITNTYRTGYDKINVNFDKETQFKILQQVIKTKLIGFEIIKKQEKSCIVENITEPSPEQFDNLLNKMFMNIEDFFKITEKRLQGEKTEDFEEVADRIQKYDNFCRRVIYKKKIIEQKSELFWAFLTLIIHGQREIYFLNKIIDKKIKVSDKTIELLKGSKKIFNMLVESYQNKNVELLGRIHELEKQFIYKKAYSLLEKKRGKENTIIYHLASSIRQFYQANSPLSGLIM